MGNIYIKLQLQIYILFFYNLLTNNKEDEVLVI